MTFVDPKCCFVGVEAPTACVGLWASIVSLLEQEGRNLVMVSFHGLIMGEDVRLHNCG